MRSTKLIVIALMGGLGGYEIASLHCHPDEYILEEPLEYTTKYFYLLLISFYKTLEIFAAWWWPRFHVRIVGTTLSNSLFVRALNDL